MSSPPLMPAGLDAMDIAEVLDTAMRIHLHALRVRFHLRIQCTAPLEAGVEHYVRVAELDPVPWEQASQGAVWGARQLRDDLIVQVAFAQHTHGEQLAYPRLADMLDRQLLATSQTHLGFTLESADQRTAVPLERYLPAPPDGPRPFWIGVTWGMVKYHTLASLALDARQHGADIMEDWLEFQLAT